GDVTGRTATASQTGGTRARGAGDGAAVTFERMYRANVEAVTAYFARRSADPHVVADLTADTFVTAITGFASFDPGKGPRPGHRSWLAVRPGPCAGRAGGSGRPASEGGGGRARRHAGRRADAADAGPCPAAPASHNDEHTQ